MGAIVGSGEDDSGLARRESARLVTLRRGQEWRQAGETQLLGVRENRASSSPGQPDITCLLPIAICWAMVASDPSCFMGQDETRQQGSVTCIFNIMSDIALTASVGYARLF